MVTGLKPEETGTFSLETEKDLLAWRACWVQIGEGLQNPKAPDQGSWKPVGGGFQSCQRKHFLALRAGQQ